MKILAIDASTEAASVALLDSETPTEGREIFEIAPRAHACLLLPAVQSLLDEAGLQLPDLAGIAFARGPGAFTGLRIAAGFVQGLAAGAGLSVVGISTLAAVAANAFEKAPWAQRAQVVQDARMGEIYTALFERATMPVPLCEERVMAPSDLTVNNAADTVHAGNGWTLVTAGQGPGSNPVVADLPHALCVAQLALPLFMAGEGGPPETAVPVYVRDDVARKPKKL